MRKGCIYSLIDPRSNLVRYIGQTIVKPTDRVAQHKYQWKRCNGRLNKLNSWIKSLAKYDLIPKLEVLEDNILEDQLDNKEIEYIKLFKSVGAKLVNGTNGGGGIRGHKMSEESKNKRLESLANSEAWQERSKRHSEIMKEIYKTGVLNLGYYRLSKEDREKASLKMIDRSRDRTEITIQNKLTKDILFFRSMKEMMEHFSCARSTIRNFIKNEKQSIKFKDFIIIKYIQPNKENRVGERAKAKTKK